MPCLVVKPYLISVSKDVHAASSFLLLCVLNMPTLWLALCVVCLLPSRAPAVTVELSIALAFLCICQRSCCRFAAALLPLFWRETRSLGLSAGATSNKWTCMCMLNRCNTLSVESQLQSKGLRWLSHVLRMPDDRLPKRLLIGEVQGLHSPRLTTLGQLRMMLHYVTVKSVVCVGPTGIHKTGCSTETKVFLLIPNSS